MDITIFLARFWGALFMILGMSSMAAKLLGRIIQYTEEKAITISTGYITFLLGLATTVAHNLWVSDWRIAITLLGWITLLKGLQKILLPQRINRAAQKFKKLQVLWGFVIFAIGAWLFRMSFQ